MVIRRTVTKVDNFDRAQALTTTPAGEFGWTVKDTSSAGTPTYLAVSGRGMKLTLTSTSEEQIVTMYQNDVLPYRIDKIKRVVYDAVVASVDAVTTLVFGIGSAQNDTEDSVANLAWFRMEGSASTSNVVVETDDGTTDLDDKATGKTLSTTLKRFEIDFTNGLTDVRFYIDGERVAASTTFDMSAAASNNAQLFVQLHKASGTGVPTVTIKHAAIEYNVADGA